MDLDRRGLFPELARVFFCLAKGLLLFSELGIYNYELLIMRVLVILAIRQVDV